MTRENYLSRSLLNIFQIPLYSIENASDAREAMNGTKLDGYTVRVDYSVTKDPNKPRNNHRDRSFGNDSYHNRSGGRDGFRGGSHRGGRGGYTRGGFDRRRLEVVHHSGGSNPAIDAKTGKRESWMGGNSYRGGFLRFEGV